MSSFNRYYLDELVSLRELGREYSRANPSLAPFFDTPGRDPDVERILEGVAFLCGRLRQKLDDELPEITHSLFSLLWPNYLRTIPSCSIVRYEPAANLSWAVTIPRGTMVESVEVEGTKCRFQTVYENQVLPVRLAEQTIFEHDGQIILSLRFELVGSTLENIPLSRLRLFFTGEPAIAHSMYFTIMHHVREIRFLLPDGKGRHAPVHVLSPQMIRPVGFREDEGLFPYPANTFPGYRIIQEYFCFIEKFLFVEISGLDACVKAGLEAAAGAEEFALHLVLTEFPEQYESWRRDNIQLFCTPVVNLFPMDSTPLNIDHRQQEYRIVPDPRLPYHYAVYSVDDVRSWGGNGKHRREYRAFESFEHGTSPEADTAYYRLRLKPSLRDESTETYISIVHSPASAASLGEEVISLELTCTNRLLPSRLIVGDINTHADDTPDTVTLGNITPVTPSYTPPLEGDLLWRLISNMSLNYLPLNNVHAMRALIASYDFRAMRDRYRSRVLDKMLGGMTRIVSEETDRIYQGLPVRGTVTRLTLDRDGFSCEGEMFLFASVINEFLALYATVNSFHQLIVIDAGRGEEYQWPARLGEEADPVSAQHEQDSSVTQDALERISGGYAFSRAVEHVVRRCGNGRPLEEWLRFRVNPDLSFPPGDIRGVRHVADEAGKERVRFVLNLMGLHGAASPLPTYFTEYVAQHQDEPDVLRDFFDVLHHRLISLFYGIWNKYRYYLQFRDNGEDINSRRFFSFIGLGHKELQGTSGLRRERLLSYMGLIAFSGDAAGSLESILRHYFRHALVHIIPCIRRQVPIPADQQCALGLSNCRLSTDFLLGSEVLDQTGKFRVLFESLSWDRFTEFLPGGSLFSELQTLVRFVLRSRLGFDVELRLRPAEIPEFTIGENSPCRLGWTTWAGQGGDGVIILETDSTYVD